MKLLFICQYYYPEQFKINDICENLSKNGHEITVLTGLPNYPNGIVEKKYRFGRNREENIKGVKIIRSWLIGRGKNKLKLALNYLSFMISSSLKALFLKKDFDAIYIYQLSPITMAVSGIILKFITKKPLALYCFDLWPESLISGGKGKTSFVYKIMYIFSRWIYKQSDIIIFSSKQFEKYFRETLRINKSFYYLPIYAEDLFDNIEKNSDEKSFNLVFAGNIGEMQSIETILYAANEIRNIENIFFHIVGDGSAKKRCMEISQGLNLRNVIFHGRYPLNEMTKFYNMADAFLITLKNDPELSYTLPGKVQTYMAAGKPIIGAINGETEIVINESKCGLCVPAEDYFDLAEKIKMIYYNKEKSEEFGKNGKKYYQEHYLKQRYFAKFDSILNCLIKTKKDIK